MRQVLLMLWMNVWGAMVTNQPDAMPKDPPSVAKLYVAVQIYIVWRNTASFPQLSKRPDMDDLIGTPPWLLAKKIHLSPSFPYFNVPDFFVPRLSLEVFLSFFPSAYQLLSYDVITALSTP